MQLFAGVLTITTLCGDICQKKKKKFKSCSFESRTQEMLLALYRTIAINANILPVCVHHHHWEAAQYVFQSAARVLFLKAHIFPLTSERDTTEERLICERKLKVSRET